MLMEEKIPFFHKGIWRTADGVGWDTSKPSPSACPKCGAKHLSDKLIALCARRSEPNGMTGGGGLCV